MSRTAIGSGWLAGIAVMLGLLQPAGAWATNSPPVASSLAITAISGSPKGFTLPVTDDTVPYYQLVCSVVQPPSNGTVALQYPTYHPLYTCYMTYTATNGFTGQDSFTYKANDGTNDSNIATVTVQVNPNLPPVASACSVSGVVGSAISIVLPVTDDGVPAYQLMCQVLRPPTNGTVGLTYSNNFPNYTCYMTYRGTNGAAGFDSFTFKANDGVQDSNVATCSVSVAANSVPAARDMARSVIKDSTNNLMVLSFTHADVGQTISYAKVADPAHGSLVSYTNSTSWSYTPAPGYAGPDSFIWAVSDGMAASTATVSISVIALSEPGTPPVFNAGVPLMDGTNTLRVWRRSLGAKFDFADNKTPATGSVAAPGLADWNNDGLMDLLVGQADGRIALFINQGTRGRPVFNGFEYLKYQNGSYIQVNHGCVCLGGGPSCAAPRVVDWNADGRKDLIVGEWGSVGQWTQIWGVDVYLNIGTDEAPVFTSRVTCDLKSTVPQTGIGSGGRATSMPFVTDMNGDGISDVISGENNVWFSGTGQYGPVGSPSGLVNIFLGTKNDHSPGANPVATDGSYRPLDSFDSPNASYTYPTVTATGACPVASRKSVVAVDWNGQGKKDLVTGMQDGTVWFSPNVGSADLPVFTNCYRLQAGGAPIVVGDPAKVGQDPGYRNAPSDYHGTATMIPCNEARLAVGDLDGDGLDDLVVGDVNGYVTFFQQYNPGPVAIDQQVEVTQGAPKSVTLGARVDSGNSVSFTVLDLPAHGMLSGTAPDLVYTPDSGYRGQDRFTFRVSDSALDSLPGTIRITVKNHPPVALDQGAVVATMNHPRTFSLQALDEGDEPLAYSIVSQPAHGTCTLDANVVTYTPTDGYAGLDPFTWKANDGYLDSNIRTVAMDVAVLAVNFQTTNAPVPPGYAMDSGSLYDTGRGYGWTTADYMGGWMNLTHMGPYPSWFGANTDPRVDTCVYAYSNATWICDLPDGSYHVSLGYGNYSQDGMYSRFQDRIVVHGTTVVDDPESYWGGPVFGVVGGVAATVTNGQLAVSIGGVSNSFMTRLDYVEIRPAARPSGWATFVQEDAATQGAWPGVHGADGYWFGNSVVNLPGYLTIRGPTGYAESNLQRSTWADPTTQARALQHPWGNDGILSGWWASLGFEYDFNFVDGVSHRVALYATDVGSTRNAWTQRVDVVDAGNGMVLDSRTLTAFTDGKYLVWDIKGHVKLKVAPVKGNAVVNALFFGSGGNLDANGDGLPDWWQIRYFGSTLVAGAMSWADPDGDGFSNVQEFLAGTDPNDPDSRLEIRSILGGAGGPGLGFDTVSGVIYDVYWKTNLMNSMHWQHYQSVLGDGAPANVVFTNPVPQGYFQLKIVP